MLVEVIILYFCLQTAAFDITGSDYKPNNFASCFDNLGCFDTTEEWYDPVHRPVNLEPIERHIIRTEFILIKRSENYSELLYDLISFRKESAEIAGFNVTAPIIFLIHDFTSNGYTGWVKHMALILLQKASSNIMSIDWESGAEPPYDQAIANARVVALEAITLIHSLKKSFNIKEEKIHIIGHGVGAHIAGYIGKNITNLGRITALDPNGPRFEHMPPKVRLHNKDAIFVEVIHTDAVDGSSQGLREPLGHVDFYMNNADFQPSCREVREKDLVDVDRDYIKAGKILPGCSHKRAFKYFIESVESMDCKFLGIKCRSYHEYLEGKCHNCDSVNGTTACAEIGLDIPSSPINGSFYVNTGSDSPYCMQPYKVSIKLDAKGKAKKGKFEIIMVGDDNEVANISTIDTNVRTLVPGKTHSFLYYASPPQLYTVKEAKVKWEHINSIDCFLFCDENIYVDEIKITPLILKRNVSTSTLCPVKGKIGIENGNYLTYVKCGSNATSLTGKNVPIFDSITPPQYEEYRTSTTELIHHQNTTTNATMTTNNNTSTTTVAD